jgi:hypothetical protein
VIHCPYTADGFPARFAVSGRYSVTTAGALLAGQVVRVNTVTWTGHGPRFVARTLSP